MNWLSTMSNTTGTQKGANALNRLIGASTAGTIAAVHTPASVKVNKLDPVGSRIMAESIITFLRAMPNVSTCIAGGYARDTYFNREPRDIDIMVVHDKYEDWSLLQLFSIETFLKSLGHEVETHQQYVEGEEGHINTALAVCFKIPELCIDILLYSKHYCKVMQAIQAFECNLNQFMIDINGTATYVGAHPAGNLQFTSGSSRPTTFRLNKMLAIAKEVGW